MHSPSKRLQSGKEINPIQVLQKIFSSFVWVAAIWTQLRTGMPRGSWPLQFFCKSVNSIPIKGGGGKGRLCPQLYYWHLWNFRLHSKVAEVYSKVLLVKSFENIFFIFHLHFTFLIICLMKAPKQFLGSGHFENTRAGFLLRWQSSLWQTTSKIMHFQTWKTHLNTYYVIAFDPIWI